MGIARLERFRLRSLRPLDATGGCSLRLSTPHVRYTLPGAVGATASYSPACHRRMSSEDTRAVIGYALTAARPSLEYCSCPTYSTRLKYYRHSRQFESEPSIFIADSQYFALILTSTTGLERIICGSSESTGKRQLQSKKAFDFLSTWSGLNMMGCHSIPKMTVQSAKVK